MKIEVDNHKLTYHPERVAEWIRNGDCPPIYVEIGLTNSCNHQCVFCALDFLERGRNFIDTRVMISTLENMADYGIKSIMFAGEGEPTLHKDLPLFVSHAKKKGIDTAITTNGVAFTEKKAEQCLPYLSWIRYSINASNSENYAKIHGTNKKDFEKVIENIRTSAEIKRRDNHPVTIGTQILIIPETVSEIENLARIVKEAGANNLQVKPYSQHPLSKNRFSVDSKELKGLKERLQKFNTEGFEVLYREETIKRIASERDYNNCFGLSFFGLINSKGLLIPCNLFDASEDTIYGNIYESNFKEIWEGDKRKEVLERLRKKGIGGCRIGCRLDGVNRYLERLKNPHQHDNFI